MSSGGFESVLTAGAVKQRKGLGHKKEQESLGGGLLRLPRNVMGKQ